MSDSVPAHVTFTSYHDLHIGNFAEALAPVIGGAVIWREDTIDYDKAYYAHIVFTDFRLSLSRGGGNKVKFRISETDIPAPIYSDFTPCKLPSATISATRSLEAIAREVKRRVIDPA